MNLTINKDFVKTYKDDTWRGFSLKEVAALGCALILAILTVIGIWKLTDIPADICVYIAVPVILPVLAAGFFTYQDMGILSILKEMKWGRKTELLVYEAGERTKEDMFLFTTDSIPMPGISAKEWKRRRKTHRRRVKREKKGRNIVWQS